MTVKRIVWLSVGLLVVGTLSVVGVQQLIKRLHRKSKGKQYRLRPARRLRRLLSA